MSDGHDHAHDDTRTGTVARIVEDRGFGFVRDNQTGAEYFFHKTVIEPSRHDFEHMTRGTAVEFEVDTDAEKPRCAVVRIVR